MPNLVNSTIQYKDGHSVPEQTLELQNRAKN